MAPSSPFLVERFNNIAQRASRLSLPSPTKSLIEYHLDRLEPRPVDTIQYDDESHGADDTTGVQHAEHLTRSFTNGRKGLADDSHSQRKPKVLFGGPPPPIATSVMTTKPLPSSSHYGIESNQEPYGLVRTMGRSIGNAMFDQLRLDETSYKQRTVPVWRSLRRRESKVEDDVQQFLDCQAAGLVFGSQLEDTAFNREPEDYSDAGSSTPTGTFYSTATSQSHMPKSLYVPPQSTRDGNVIPVRQPARSRPPGLRAARNGLRKSIKYLVDLRCEETDYITVAIEERRAALEHLSKLGTRRLGIQTELAAFDDDEEEPLARELRELEGRHAVVDRNISMLEEKLMSLRNQRRWLREKMSDVKGKREAGLSGYRGALKDVDSELSMFVRRPPILPLEPAIQSKGDDSLIEEIASAGGAEFLRLIPNRRSPEMAKSWWEAELVILEKRRMQVNEDRLALEKGALVWDDIVSLVSNFESELRRIMKGGAVTASSFKGKEKATSEVDLVRNQMMNMSKVVVELEQAMELVESNGWNLLICAIGAELEAFKEAHDMLTGLLSQSDERPNTAETLSEGGRAGTSIIQPSPTFNESVNDVPSNLLVSRADGSDQLCNNDNTAGEDGGLALGDDRPHSQDSENEVPLEFLAEHE
ncbi:hypothetical protein QQS21_002877 [Conoideocrella luteorostrata]|uniref:Autophagy-related protein 28 n=1 Tax=Conoideocrella luteorostrata TaxID=1105319 RepID=A0AAJ0CU77_9HYPO|nr:hypothetical protein QQS21_002877 [Conoideocrella luteorostrata]